MEKFKKIVILIMIEILISTIVGLNLTEVSAKIKVQIEQPIKAGVLLYNSDNLYISEIGRNLEQIQKDNEGKIQFTFYDGKYDQNIQNESIDKLLTEKVDLLIISIVDINQTQEVINKIKENNIPVIFFVREPNSVEDVRSYSKAIFIGSDPKEGGILQGKLIIDLWVNNKELIDRNRDGILQYIMLMGEEKNLDSIGRTRYSVSTIQKAGIETQEIALQVCNWDRQKAKEFTDSILLQYGQDIEMFISNNDEMAIGAIESLKEKNYNKGGKLKTITVVGFDGLPEAEKLIKEGSMSGTVLINPSAIAEAIYVCGMNLVNDKTAIDETNYKFDDTGVSIRIPYLGYTKN